MKNTRKILVALLVVLTLLMSLAVVASATATTTDTTIYLTPNANWKVDNARFAAYTWDGGDQWFDMADTDGDGVYECVIPAGVENIIFCRMNPGTSTNNWTNKWNQTADLKYDGTNNHYTVTEGTWDKGGGTWSLLELGECIHAPSGEGEVVTAATCTENGEISHVCSKCGESYSAVILATGHTYEGSEAVCACGTQAKFNIAGDNATLFGAEWDATSTANYLEYDEATGLWSISYTNNLTSSVWPNFKICLDNGWNTCWGGSAAGQSDDNAWVEIPAGKVLTISFDYVAEKITFATSDPHTHTYTYPCDKVCNSCFEESNPDAKHNVVHIEAVAATCYENGNVEYWYCEACGQAWLDEACTLNTNLLSVVLPMAHGEAKHFEAKDATCTAEGNIEYWLCEACGQAWLDADCTLNTNVKSVILPMSEHSFVDGKCSACGAEDPNYVPPHTHVWSDATCTEPQRCECGETQGEALGHTPGAAATCTVPQTCTVCGIELAPTIPHVDANLDITCDYDGCTKRILPPADSKVSLFTANHMIIVSLSNNYYVEGVVTEVIDAKNGNFIITDADGDQLYIRMPVDANGVSHSGWEMKIVVGDAVSVYGKPKNTSGWNTTLKAGIQSGVLTFIDQHDHVANGDPVCSKDTLCACGAVVAPATGHIDADGNGICDKCPWDMNLVEVNIAIGTADKYNGVRVDDDAGKALSWTWSNGGFDAIISKGTSTFTLYTTAKDYMQLKKQNLLTIVNTEDVTIKYVTISVTTLNYLNTLKTAIGTQYEFTADETNLSVTIQLNSTEDLVLENQATSTIYVNGVSIVYAKKGAHVHEFVGTVTTPATCTEAGLKTFTCECGEGTYTEVIEALGHDFVEGVCSRCEAVDPDYVPACNHKDIGLDAKCDLCGEWFLPTSPFKLEMYQASKKQTYYFTGAMSTYYFATSTDISKAVDLYAEEVEGGYNVYFMSGSTKNYLYIELSGTHINAKYGSTKAVWYVDPTYGCLTTELDGTKYFLGTYSSYVTFGGTAYSRLNDSTADISQYIGRAVSLENHECTNTTSTVTAPTCTTEGYTTFKCADCGLSTTGDYVDALGHDIVADAAVDATCTESGLTAGEHCTRCDHKVAQETVEALGHDVVADAAVDATCTESGLTAGEHCTRCDYKVAQETIEALGHDIVVDAAVEATCTESGLTAGEHCTKCDHKVEQTVVEALGHDMLTHTETLPTCTEAGIAAGEACFRCDHKTGFEEIPALGHDFAEGQCTRCGETDPTYVPEQPDPEQPDPEQPDPENPDPEQPAPELTLFQKIVKAVADFFANIANWFKNLFAGFKK